MIAAEAPVQVFDEIDSTIVEARRRAEAGDLGPVWLVARRQTAGRGRRGRSWASLDGNLMATYLGPAARPPAEIALLGFAAGLAIAEVFEAQLGPGRATLKWPNDVLIDGAKAAGVMLDSGGAWFALAFGVNLAAAPEGLDQPTTFLRATVCAAPEPEEFLAYVSGALEAWTARLDLMGFAPLRAAWLARAHGLGKPARVAMGDTVIEGVIAGLSERGELELDTATGRRLVAAGDILIVSANAV